MMKKIINLTLFQIAWFAAVLGEAKEAPWLGPLVMVTVLALHLFLTDDRQRELKLLLAAGLLGFLYDTARVNAGVFAPFQHLVPAVGWGVMYRKAERGTKGVGPDPVRAVRAVRTPFECLAFCGLRDGLGNLQKGSDRVEGIAVPGR